MQPTPPPPPAPQLPLPPPPGGSGPDWQSMRPVPPPPHKPMFTIRSGATARIVLWALLVGVAFDLVWRQGIDTVSGVLLVAATSVAILASRRLRGRPARLLV